jgi:TadE-like protein
MTDLRRFRPNNLLRDEDGATLVEFAIVISLFLLIFFGLIDFGRLAYHIVTGERAMQAAARIGAVRPPACPGVPEFLELSSDAPASTDYGTSCNAGGPICEAPAAVSCTGDMTNATAAEVWEAIGSVMSPGSDVSNLRFSYTYDARLGFLGGPYVPVVTVAMEDVTFDFVTPLAGLAAVAGATGSSGIGSTVTMPSMSVSLPGEDLAQGEDG